MASSGDEVTPPSTGDDVTPPSTGDDVTPPGSDDEMSGDPVTPDEGTDSEPSVVVSDESESVPDLEAEDLERARPRAIPESVSVQIADADAARFWTDMFSASTLSSQYGKVSFEMLAHALEKRFPPTHMQPLLRDRLLYDETTLFHLVRYVIDYAVQTDGVITIDEFNKFVQRFGPFERCVLNCINALFSHRTTLIVEWFWGEYANNRPALERESRNVSDSGRFLVMFPDDDAPHLTLRIHDGSRWRVVDIHNDNGEFHLRGEEPFWRPRLQEHLGEDHSLRFDSLHAIIEELILCGRITMGLESPLFKASKKRAAEISSLAGGLVGETRHDVCVQTQTLRGVIKSYYAASEIYATRETVYWNQLCDRVESAMTDNAKHIDRNIFQLDHELFNLRCDLESAIDLWGRALAGKADLIVFDEEFGVERAHDDFQRLEDAIYTGVVAILEVLFPDKRLVLEEPRPPTRHFDWMERSHNLRVRRLFFFRMFGVDFAETLRWADLGKALEIYLRVEFGRVHIAPRAITQLMLTVSNLPAHRAKTPISKDEWQLFMYRFGPLQHCYDKASAICEVTSPTDDHPQISLARWFRFWERPKTEVALNWHARESRLKARFPQYKPAPFERAHPHTLFYLRHGRGAEHIFSMSFVRRNENKPRKTDALPVRGRPRPPPPQAVWSHTKILACPMPGKPHTAPDRGYHFENNPNCYSDMHGLVEMVVNRLKWSELEQPLKDQNYQWLVMNAHWSNIHSETDQPVHHLMEFNRHLGGYVTKLVADGRISPNDFKPPKKTSGQRIREMLHARDLDAFVRYCSDKDTPIDERRAALASYRKGAIVHEIIRVAVSNSDWTRALEAVRDTFTRRGVLSREGERLFHHAHQINRLTPAEAIVAESFEAVHDAVPSWLSTFDRDAFENALPNDDAVRLLEVFEDSDLLAPEDLFRVLLLSIKHVHLGLFERVIRCASTRVLSRLCSVEDIINPTHAMRLGNNLFHTISALSIPDCSIVEQYQTHFCRRLATFIWSVTADRLTKGDSLRAGRRRSRRASALSSTQQGTTSPWFRLIDARNVAGQTPAMMAAERRRRNLLQFYLHQCEASYDVLDENNNSLFNYILADLDKWLRDDPNEKLLNLLSQSQRLTHTVNHRNRNNQSPLFIVVSKLKHLEDMEKSDSVSGDLTQMLSLKEDVEVLEKLVYKLLASGALMDSLSGHQAKSDELRTYFLNKLISAMADDVEDKDRWLIFESAVRNRDTELVKGILDSKELPYFFCPPDLSGTFDSDINQLSLYATKKEDPALATQPLTRTMRKKKRRANARQSIDFVSGDEDSDDYDAIEQQSTRRRGKSLSSRPVRRVHTFDSANRKRHQAQVVQGEEALLRDDDDNPGDDVDSEDERKHDADDEPLVEAATSSRKVRAATSAATSRSYGTRRSPSAKAPSSSKSPRPRDDSRPSTEDHDEADTAEESVAPLKSILHVAVGLRDQDPQLVDMLLTAAPKPKILDQTSQRIVDEGLKDAAGGEERPRRRECLRPNPDAIDRRGRTALHVVAQLAEPSSRSLEIAKSLLAHIDVLAKDWRGYTALHYAAENGNLELVRLLLEAHAEPSEVSTDGAKLDSYKRACGALRAGERKWVRDSNSVVIKGRTALHLAAKRGHWQVAAELLKDVKVSEDDEDDNSLTDPIDDTGRTPLCLALERRQEMLKYRGRFKEEDANQRRDGNTKSKSGKDKSAQAMSKTAPSVGRSTSKRLALASPTGSVPRSLTDGMASPQQRTARHLRQHSIEMQTVAHDESRMLRPSTLAWKDDMVRHLLPVGVSDPLAVADLKRQSSADSYMHKHRSRSRSQLRSQGSSGLSSRRAMTMMPSSTNVTGPAPSEAPFEGPPPSDAGDPESGYADDTYEAKSRRLKEVHRNHVQMQLIMQMLQDVGEEVLDDRVAQWETSMMVSLEINDYGEIEFKDVSKLERNFDNTVKKLLASGASIEVATNSAGYDLTDLIDIDTQWDSINEDVQRFEREKIYQQITDGALAPMYNQKKQDVFSERQNQIVIDYRYKSQVWNMLAVRLFAYMLFVAAATLLAIQETTKDELSAHFFYESLEQTLVGDEFPHNVSQLLRTYEDIDDKSEFYMWMRGPFLDVFYPEPAVYYAQGDELHRRDLGFINKQARLIGVPRLRQLRSQNTSCDVPYEWRKTGVDLECFTTANEPDTTTFGPDIAGVGPWKYYTESKLKGVQTWGRTGFFGGDGHVIDLPAPVESGSREKMHQLALDLEEYSFIDVKTRAVFLEFSAFDAHENFFAVCHIMLEFPRAGGTVVSSSFNVAPMRRYVDQRDNTWTLYLEVIVVLMLVLYIVNQTGPGAVRFFTQDLWKEPSKEEEEVSNGVEDEHQGKAYMFELTTDTFPFKIREPQVKSPNSCAKAGSACWKSCCTPTKRRWTLARIWLPFRRIFAATMSALSVSITEDGALVNWGLRCSIAAILYLRIVNVAEASDIDWEEQRAYVPVQRLGRFTVVESQAWSVFIFFAWFKLLTFLKVFRALSKLLIMIDFMLADLLDFAILLLIVLIAFASAEYVAYGYADPSSPTWLYSFITRFSYAFSGREIDGRNELNRVLGVIYPMIFVIIVLLLLLNLLIAILTSAYDRARTRAGKSYWARWQYEKIRSENDAPPVLSGAFLLDVITGVYTQCKGPCRRALARIHPDSYLPSGSSGGSSGGSGGSSDPSRSHSRHQSRGSI